MKAHNRMEVAPRIPNLGTTLWVVTFTSRLLYPLWSASFGPRARCNIACPRQDMNTVPSSPQPSPLSQSVAVCCVSTVLSRHHPALSQSVAVCCVSTVLSRHHSALSQSVAVCCASTVLSRHHPALSQSVAVCCVSTVLSRTVSVFVSRRTKIPPPRHCIHVFKFVQLEYT